MRVSYFGRLREQLQTESEEFYLITEIRTAGELRDWLVKNRRNGSCLQDKSVRVIIGDDIATWEDKVNNTSEVAFIPPVSGG